MPADVVVGSEHETAKRMGCWDIMGYKWLSHSGWFNFTELKLAIIHYGVPNVTENV